ncbi:hypothetical protein HC081234_16680 [Helicobacter cinaedi]|nr:hypothetical protein HC081234_16680 [Helicobacter cinaedi]
MFFLLWGNIQLGSLEKEHTMRALGKTIMRKDKTNLFP